MPRGWTHHTYMTHTWWVGTNFFHFHDLYHTCWRTMTPCKTLSSVEGCFYEGMKKLKKVFFDFWGRVSRGHNRICSPVRNAGIASLKSILTVRVVRGVFVSYLLGRDLFGRHFVEFTSRKNPTISFHLYMPKELIEKIPLVTHPKWESGLRSFF